MKRRDYKPMHIRHHQKHNPHFFCQSISYDDIKDLEHWVDRDQKRDSDGQFSPWFTGRGPYLPNSIWPDGIVEARFMTRKKAVEAAVTQITKLLNSMAPRKSIDHDELLANLLSSEEQPSSDSDEEEHWDTAEADKTEVWAWLYQRLASWDKDLRSHISQHNLHDFYQLPEDVGQFLDNWENRPAAAKRLPQALWIRAPVQPRPWGLPAQALRLATWRDESLNKEFWKKSGRDVLTALEKWYF